MFVLSSSNFKFVSLVFISAFLVELIGPTLAHDSDYDDDDYTEATYRKPRLHGNKIPEDLITFDVDLVSVISDDLDGNEESSEEHKRTKRSLHSRPPKLYCGGYTKTVCQLICGNKERLHFWCSAKKCMCFGYVKKP
ncbi:unnamed protein product [Allacma fusca]|uniref:Uncharacterized protein n=1 Tax=Allacma fusca TaxID=39272 RepID=A0A8J2M9F2_9HEXA|nr:unnamed protein product [Allacma fusca]